MEEERMRNVLKWYVDNKEADPNIFELVEVLSQVSRSDNINLEMASVLADLEIDRLFKNKIIFDEKDNLIQMIREIKDKVISGEEISYEEEDFVKSLSGISFYLKTNEARNNGEKTVYDNRDEFVTLFDLREKMLDNGLKYSDNMRSNYDFIYAHYKNDLVALPGRFSISAIANKRALNSGNKFMEMLEQVKPYVYPERIQELIDYCEKDDMLPTGIAFQTIIDLGVGIDFDTVLNKIEQAELSEWGLSDTCNVALMFAKNGPDFWQYVSEKNNYTISQENLDYLNNRKEENLKLESMHNSDFIEHTF